MNSSKYQKLLKLFHYLASKKTQDIALILITIMLYMISVHLGIIDQTEIQGQKLYICQEECHTQKAQE